MKNLFVSPKMALKLKKLGFDAPCIAIFIGDTPTISLGVTEDSTDCLLAPLYQQAIEYLQSTFYVSFTVTPINAVFFKLAEWQVEIRFGDPMFWNAETCYRCSGNCLNTTFSSAYIPAIEAALTYLEKVVEY